MKNYSDLLKDPRWQKKRLEIFSRDAWTCRICDDDKTTLNVHHILYESPFPWETSDRFLITLCEKCHALEESLKGHDFYPIVQSEGLTRIELNTMVKSISAYMALLKNRDVNSYRDLIRMVDWAGQDAMYEMMAKELYNG